jgi:hypothetical protein
MHVDVTEEITANTDHDEDCVDEVSVGYEDGSDELGNCDLTTATEVKLEPGTSDDIGTLFDQLMKANNRSERFSE